MPKQILEKEIKLGGQGIVNNVTPDLIGDAASQESLNFVTKPDCIEIVGGRRLIGAEETDTGEVMGLFVATKADGTEVPLRKIGTKLQYFDTATELWVDIVTNLIEGEPLYFDDSNTPAGRQVWMCGQDGLFKLYPSSPQSLITLTDSTKNYKGKILIDKSRMLCWGMKEDPTGLRFSKVDKDSNYTSISAEAVGISGSTTYSVTLAHGQLFGLVVTDGTQILRDDKNGNLTGDGTGTINYATGELSVTFNATTTGAVTADYLYEDPVTGGLADFTYSASRLAGEGNIQRQDSTGSKSMNVLNFNNRFYTLQNKGSWVVSIDIDDVKWNNEIYRSSIGIPTTEASVITADGIVFIDTIDPTSPRLRLLGLDQYNENVIPYDLTDVKVINKVKVGFKLSDYDFSSSVLFRYHQFIFISCKKDSQKNNRIIIYNKNHKTFDVVSYGANWFAVYNNSVWIGDSASNNVYEIFTGIDDLDYPITAQWKSGKDALKTPELKKYKLFRIAGLIDPEQVFAISARYDNDNFQPLGVIDGTESYVDKTKTYAIGSEVIGEDIIGLGKSTEARYFMTELKVNTPKFKHVEIQFEPQKIGYVAIYSYSFADIRLKGNKLPKKYKTTTKSGVGFDTVGSNNEIT